MRSARDTGKLGLAVLGLIAAERDADDVDVVLLHRSDQRPAPPAADVEQRHSRLEVQLVQRQIQLGILGFFEGHVVALKVGARVGHGGVKKQREELVRNVVDRLRFFVERS